MAMKKNGFTILEILISVGVLAVVSTLIAQVLFTTTRVNKKVASLEDVKVSGEFAMGVMERLIRDSVATETVCDVDEETTPAAKFRNADNGETTLTCLSDGTAARIASVSAAGPISYLTNSAVTLSESGATDCTDSSLAFSCPKNVGVSTSTTITFFLGQLGQGQGSFEAVRSHFQSSVTPRN